MDQTNSIPRSDVSLARRTEHDGRSAGWVWRHQNSQQKLYGGLVIRHLREEARLGGKGVEMDGGGLSSRLSGEGLHSTRKASVI